MNQQQLLNPEENFLKLDWLLQEHSPTTDKQFQVKWSKQSQQLPSTPSTHWSREQQNQPKSCSCLQPNPRQLVSQRPRHRDFKHTTHLNLEATLPSRPTLQRASLSCQCWTADLTPSQLWLWPTKVAAVRWESRRASKWCPLCTRPIHITSCQPSTWLTGQSRHSMWM